MKPKQFSKEHPCTKIDIWNCFYGEGSEEPVEDIRTTNITRAKAIIGRNVPSRLVQAGHAGYMHDGGTLLLTREGVHWLHNGLRRYLKNQPERANEVENLPRHLRRRLWKLRAKEWVRSKT